MSDSMQSQTLALLRDLDAQRIQLEEEHSKRLGILKKKIEAVQVTAQLLSERDEKPSEPPQMDHLEIPKGLRGMTQHAALEALARSNGGVIKIVDVVPILKRFGILKSKKNAWNIVYSVIKRKGNWERAGKGEYRLIDDEDERQQAFVVEPPADKPSESVSATLVAFREL